jgi:hypothetical protein
MNWQDAVLTVGNLLFFLTLIPSIRSKDKPHLATSISTAITLAAFGITYITMDLVFASVGLFLNAGMWFVLAYQKFSHQNTSN